MLTTPTNKINGEIFNAGYQNHSVGELAKIIKKVLDDPAISFEYITTDDIRSYHINSDKIMQKLAFTPQYSIEDAVRSLKNAYKNGLIIDGLTNPYYYNIKMMQQTVIP
jgi:nucleoside-diphosphate-sugar epimerase